MDLIKEEEKLDLFKHQLDFSKIPKHVAIIMDGNRRWAKRNNFPSIIGHTKGAETLTECVKLALDLNIKVLSVYAFSTENWLRSKDEIDDLMHLFYLYVLKEKEFLKNNKVALNFIGDLSKCPKDLQNAFKEVKDYTAPNAVLDLVVAINYGARDEMRRAIIKMAKDKKDLENITEEEIKKYLDTSKYPDPELLVRTSGEMRISNFLLWQISYSEFYVTQTLWPDFSNEEFIKALMEYQRRKRRLGGE